MIIPKQTTITKPNNAPIEENVILSIFLILKIMNEIKNKQCSKE